jgi:hypothetical protein
MVRDIAEGDGGDGVNEDVHFAVGLTCEQLSHRERTTAVKACRLVPVVLALLLVGLLTYAVVLPLADQWRQGTSTVLVDR